jgi:hypothetical protein
MSVREDRRYAKGDVLRRDEGGGTAYGCWRGECEGRCASRGESGERDRDRLR